MQFTYLGDQAIEVPKLCLGSMTWGSQNTPAEGHQQIDMALAHGLNFIDTAEMYPVGPIKAETIGHSEATIGSWLAQHGQRDKLILATKITGEGLKFVRDGARITPAAIDTALNASLQRLNTDYVDIYQLHWPNRGSYHFRRYWHYAAPKHQAMDTDAHFAAVTSHLDELVKAGKIRHWGLSNETAWGMAKWISHSTGKTRPISIQNEYSLLCRLFDTDLGELCVNENVGLLAYSPLACGLLTGKYQNGAVPPNSRKAIDATLFGRSTERVWPAIDAYLQLAREHDLDPVHMALAWAMQRPFMGSVIFGAKNLQQLETALTSQDLVLSEDICQAIDKLQQQHPMPF